MTRTIHVCLDVRGCIHNGEWRRSLVGACYDSKTSRKLTASEILDELLDHVAAGHKVIPYGNPCEGFSYETGCPGHPEGSERDI